MLPSVNTNSIIPELIYICMFIDMAPFSSHRCLMVDLQTLRSLQIFVDESHPSNMGIGKPKEGFSVFGMLQAKCTTNMVGMGNIERGVALIIKC